MTAFPGNDRFEVRAELGAGGMGVVYEAFDRERGAAVAIKTLHIQDGEEILRLKHEFRVLRDLRHPNLVELGELFEIGGTWFFTMELVRGVDVRSYVREDGGGFDEARLRAALAGLAAGLAALHRAGKVHCDIKPSNVLVTDSGRVVVLDLGIAAELGDASAPRRRMVGSPLYMAPEQVRGAHLSPAADWYAVGVILFEMLIGERPINGSSAAAIIHRKVREQAPHPADLLPDVPEDLADLCHRMLARSPAQRPGEAEILAVLGVDEDRAWPAMTELSSRPTERLFVGRSEALSALARALDSTRKGQAAAVLIEGESGVGKTALCERFLDEVRGPASTVPAPERRSAGAVAVFRGRCHERELVPYNAFDGIIDDMARYLRAHPWRPSFTGATEMLAPLLSVFPVLRGVPGLPEDPGPMHGDVRRLAFHALRRLLGHIADETTLILCIDDLHWADADSAALLAELMGARRVPSLLLLCTARPLADGRPCPAARAIPGELRRIALGGLPMDEAEELAQRLTERLMGEVAVDTAAIVAETGGHPMFMDELVRHMARQAELTSVRGAHLDDALRRRIATLDAEARRLLEIIAVAGAPLPRQVVAAASGLPPPVQARRLAALIGAQLVRTGGPGEESTVAPYHDRVREAVYDHLPAAERSALHGTLARTLEALGTEPVQLATHYYHAGLLAEAAQHAVAAARKAARSLAFDQAAELYSMALSALPAKRRRRDERWRLMAELGGALQNAGRTPEAARAFVDAAGMAPEAEVLELRRRAAELWLVGGYLDEGLAAMREVLAVAGMKLVPSGPMLVPRVLWNLVRLHRSDMTWSEPHDPAALATVDVCWSAAAGLSLVDTLRGMYFTARGALLALRAGEPLRVARALCASSVSASAIGQPAIAARMRDAGDRAAAQHGSEEARFFVETARFIYGFFYEQRWRSCIAAGHGLERVWQAAGKGRTFELDFVILFSSWAQGMLGDMNELARFVDMYAKDARRVGNRLLEVSLRASHGLVHLAADDPERARADVTDAIESWLPGRDVFHLPHLWAVFSLTEVQIYRGQPFATSALEPMFRKLVRSPLRKTRWALWQHEYLDGRLALARGAALRAAGRKSGMRAEIRRAAGAARRLADCPAPVPRCWSALLGAGVAELRGDREAAAHALGVAWEGLCDAETQLHAAAASHRLGQILGGSAGAERVAEARAAMQRLGVARPERMVALLAPGWSD